MLAQIRIIKVHEVLAQIIRDNFFSMKGQGQKLGVCWHKSQKTDFNMFQHKNTKDNCHASAASVMKGRNDLPLAIRKVLVLLLI